MISIEDCIFQGILECRIRYEIILEFNRVNTDSKKIHFTEVKLYGLLET